jgi:hypothetical protein
VVVSRQAFLLFISLGIFIRLTRHFFHEYVGRD